MIIQVKAGTDKNGKEYSFNMLGEDAKGDKRNQKITSGTLEQKLYKSYQYDFTVKSGYKKDGKQN